MEAVTDMIDENEYRCTEHLRFVTPSGTTTKPPRLQQKWARPIIDKNGHVTDWETLWRDVPLVVEDSP